METYQTSFPLGDESSQMCSLNQRLEAYLSRVKALEEENELLKAEILHLRKEKKTPSARRYHQEIMKLRDALDDGYQKMVEAERARDNIYQEIEYVKDLCLQEKQVREEVKKEMSESQKLLEEEKRAQTWLKERLVLLEEEMEEILKVHEEEKAAMEEEILSFSRRLDSFKVAPVAFQPVNVEDYAIKLSQIWQGAVEDYKSEVSDLESSLSEAKENLRKVQDEKKQSQLQLQNLERDLLSLKSRKEMLEEVIGKQWLDQQEEEGRLQLEFETLENEKQDLRAQIAQVLEDRQQLMHLKMSLSLEVATYRSLLEVESTRLYSPTADYKLSSPFSDFVFEKSPLRKRQAESMKTPVAKDYRLISTKRQSAEKSQQWTHTPSRHLNVKSTSFSSKPSPVTKEFQKVSSVLQSQSLKYTKASTNKAATPIPSVKIERRPPTEDVFKKSKVETISYSYSQGSTKDQPLKRTLYSKNDAELTITEAVENGFVLPDEKEIIAAQVKTDHLESSLKTVKDHHTIVHHTAMEDQQGSLKVDINVKDLELNDEAQGKEDLNVQHIEFNLPTQAFENEESYLVVEKEEVGTCQMVLSEKQEVVQSLEYQNIETLIKEDVKDHLMVPAISEPFTSDAKADLLAATPTHEQENSTTIISAETEEPKAPSSEVVSEPLTQQEQDLVCQISFDLEHAISLSSKLQADQKTESEPDNSSLEKLETESEIQAEEAIVDQQIISTLKENNTQLFNEELIEYKGQENEDKKLQEDFDLKLAQSESPLEKSKDSTNTVEQLDAIKQEICNSEEEIKKEESSQEHETEQSSEFVKLVEDANQIPKDSENNQELNQEEQTSLELHSLEQKNKIYNVRKTQIICVTEQMTEQFIVDNNEVVVQLDATQADNMYLSETGLKEIKKELESLELGEKEQEILDILGTQIGAYEVQVTKLELGEATNQLSDATEDNVPLFENVDESQHVKQEEQKLSQPRDSEQDQSDLGQALDIQLSEDNQNLPDDNATEDVAQLLNDIDDGGQSVDKSQEQFCDNKQDGSIVSKTEPVNSLPSFQEEKYIEITQTEQQDKLSLDQDSLPSESKDDAIEEPQSAHQTSLSYDSAGNDVNAVVEESAVNQFCELKQDSAQTFAEKEDSIPDELKSLEPPVAEEDIPKVTDGTITLQKKVEQPFEEESEPCIKQDMVEEPTTTNSLQENQQKEYKSEEILTESKKTEEDILLNESEQANQELVDSVACAVSAEEVELDSPVLADGVQETEPSFELISDAESKIVFQIESEDITQWTEKVIMHECTFSEQHANANLLAVLPPHEQEKSTTLISAETEEPKAPSPDVVSEFEPLTQQEQDFIGQISFDIKHAISLSSKLQVDHKTELEQDNSSFQKLETESKVHEEEAIADQQIIGTLKESNTQLLNDEEVVEDKGQEKEIEELQEDFDLKLAQAESPLEESKDSITQWTEKAIIQELDQEPLSDIQPEIVLQREDADEEPSEGPKEQTSQDNLEKTKQDTTEEDEKNSKDFKDSEANQEQDLVEEPLFGEESQFSLEQKNKVCFSEAIKEEISKETDEAISETAEQVTTVDSQVESKHFVSPEADQEPAFVQEDVSDGKILFQQESVEKHTSEDTKEIISEVDWESVTEIVKMDTSEEGRFLDSQKTEADREPELDHESIFSTEATITDQQESVLDFDKATEEEIIEESSKIVSTIVDRVFSEKNGEVEQLEKAESAEVSTEQQSQATEIKTEKCISGTESTESDVHLSDVEPLSQESRLPELDKKPELDQEPLSDIQPEIALQQEDADEYSSKGSEEQTSHNNFEKVTEMTKQDTTEEDEKDSKDSKDSEDNQGQDLVEEPIFGSESQFTLEQKNEKICFSEAPEEEISKVTVETILKTEEHDISVENQEESKAFVSFEADQEAVLVQEVISDVKTSYQQEHVDKHASEGPEENINQVSCEAISETVEKDTTEENEEDSKDSQFPETDREPEPDHDSISSTEAKIIDQHEIVLDFDKETEEIIEKSSEVVSTMAENVFFEKKEVEQLEETETAVVYTDQESHTPEIKTEKSISGTENTESEAHLGDVEPFVQESQDQKPELDQEIVLQHEDAGEYSSKDPEQTSQDNFEKVTDLTKHDTTDEDEQDSMDSKDSDSNQGQDLVKEPLLDSESQLTVEQKNEEVCFSEATEEDISKENDEAISETAEQDTTAEGQEESKEFVSPEADQEIVLVPEDSSDVKISFQQESEEKHISEDTEEKISEVTCETVSETVAKDTPEENEEESKDSKKTEADKEPEPVHESLSSAEAKITHQQESVLDFDKETEEEIIEESSEIVSTIVENVFSEKKEVEQLEETESAVVFTEQQSQAPEIKTEKCISGTENTESDAHLSDVEPLSQESQDPEPDQKPELDQEPISDIQQEIVFQQEDAGEYSSKGPEEQTSQDNFEKVTKTSEQDTTEEDEQDNKEANQGHDLVKESLFDLQSQITVEQINEEVCVSKATEEDISDETEEAISETAEQDTTTESQVESTDFVSLEAGQETVLVQENVSDIKISFQQENIEQLACEVTEEILSELNFEAVSDTVGKDTSEENEVDSKDSQETEADQEPELGHESIGNPEQQESVFDFDKGTEEEIIEESSKIVSTIVENVFSEKNEEVEQLEKAESAVVCTEQKDEAPEIEMEKYIGGTENTEAHLSDVEPLSQESLDPKLDQKPELDQKSISDIQLEISLQQEDADGYSIKSPEEQTSQDNVENVTEMTKRDTLDEVEQDSNDSRVSEVNQGQYLIEEPLFDSESQFTLEQKSEEVCFSEASKEEKSEETDETISETAKLDTPVDNQEESIEFVRLEADQEAVLAQGDVSDVKISYQQKSIESHTSEGTEEKISEVSVSETVAKDASEEHEEDSKDSRKSEAEKEPELDQESLSSAEAKIPDQQESVFDLDKGTDEKICEESSEVISTMVENVFSEKKEVETFEETESAVASTDHESPIPEVERENFISGTENTKSDAHLSDVEPLSQDSQDPELERNPELDQEPISEIQQNIALQQEGAGEYSIKDSEEQTSQDNLEIVTKIIKPDTTEEDEQVSKDSRDSEANEGQDLVEEPLFDSESQFNVEQKNEEVCFSEATEKKISQETVEVVSKTAEQVTTVKIQEYGTDSRDSEVEQEQEIFKEVLPNTQQIEETYSSNLTAEAISQETDEVVSKTEQEETFKENEEDQQLANNECDAEENKATTIDQEQESKLPEIGKDDQISEFDNTEERTQDYEPVSKELKDHKVDQEIEHDADSQKDVEAKGNFQFECEHETHGQTCDVKEINQDIQKVRVILLEQDEFTLISAEHENQCSGSKLEESAGQNINGPEDTIQETVDSNTCPLLTTVVKPDSAVNIYKQETELDSDQCSDAKATSQQEIEDEHLKQSSKDKELIEETYEVASTAEDCSLSKENEEVVSSQTEPEDDQNIKFSLFAIQNNLRFTSENDAEVQPEKQCELSLDGAKPSVDLVADGDKKAESTDVPHDEIAHDSLNKEEGISEEKDLTENKHETEITEKKEEAIVSEPSCQDSTFAPERNNQIQENQEKYLESETNDQGEEKPTASETESETILVEHSVEQKLYAENPTVTPDFEGLTDKQSKTEDVETHSNLDEEISKSDESLDSQDISIYSQKSEDFEISKDYQLEQTLPDSTPLPNLDEFEDFVDDKENIVSEEAQNVVESCFLPEPETEELDDNLELQSSQIAPWLEAEEPKETGKSLNSQEDILISSQKSDNFETSDEDQLEKTLPSTTPISHLTDGSENLSEEQVILEPETPQTDDGKDFQKDDIEQSGTKETESVSETTEFLFTAEHAESELVTPLTNDVTQEESTYTNPEQNVVFPGDDSDSLENSFNSQEDVSISSQKSVIFETSNDDQLEKTLPGTTPLSNLTDGSEILSEEQVILEPEQPQTDDGKEFQEDDIEDTQDTQERKTLEHTQDVTEVIAIATETSVILESDTSISSDESSPNVTAIGQETEQEDNKIDTEETPPDVEVKEEIVKVVLEEVEETHEDKAFLTTKPGPEHVEFHASDEEKDTTDEISDSSFDSNSGNEREIAEEQHCSPTENSIHVKTVNGLHGNTIVQATLDLEDYMVNGHSTGEQSKIVISERKTIVKFEEDIINTHTKDIIEESVLKFATSEGKSEGLFQSLLEKSELKEGTRFDESSEIKSTIHTVVEYVDSATDEDIYTNKTLEPYLSDSDFTNQSTLVGQDLVVDKDTNQQTVKTHQEKEDAWSSDE
ncbi:nestin [Rana temporaria]|uniref:nestin n=1 Tax=Rana temporaria TaxID=8407 RepID=UPI001AAD31CA|nr:nestin [Rana temporaria]